MNYLPFKEIAVGSFFRDLDHNALHMKLSQNNQAVLLEAKWVKDRNDRGVLLQRGSVNFFDANTCVRQEVDGDMVLASTPETPRNPFLPYWKEGDKHPVGKSVMNHLPVFAGLFLYAGMGVGSYFSKTGEIISCNKMDAEALAEKEDVPYVYYDSFDTYYQSSVEQKRCDAQRSFDKKKAAASAQPA